MTENSYFQDSTVFYISGGRRLFAAVSVTELPEVEHLSPVHGVDPRHLRHHQDPDPQQAGQRGESEHTHASLPPMSRFPPTQEALNSNLLSLDIIEIKTLLVKVKTLLEKVRV